MHPEHDDEALRPISYRGGDSPEHVDLPFWLDACIALDPPRRPNGATRTARHSIYPVARAMLAQRIKSRGDEAVELNRTDLARWAGYDHARNCSWIFTYLQRIGFLEIHRHPAPGGQQPDTFDVFFKPPPNYIGPRSFSELDMALREQAAGTHVKLFAQVKPNSAREEVGSEPTSAREEAGSQNPRSEPNSAREEVGSEPFNSKESFASRSERSEAFASLKEAAASLRGASGGFPNEAEVREMVRTAPWHSAGHVITHAELDVVVPFVADAMQRYGLSLVQAQEHLDGKIGKLASRNPVKRIEYVVRGFRDYLPEHVTTPDAAAAPGEQRSLAASEASKKTPKIHQDAPKGSREGQESGETGTTPQRRSQGENRPVVPPAPAPPSDEEVADPETVRSYLASIPSFVQEKNRRRRRQERDRALQGLEPEQAVADSAADGEQAG